MTKALGSTPVVIGGSVRVPLLSSVPTTPAAVVLPGGLGIAPAERAHAARRAASMAFGVVLVAGGVGLPLMALLVDTAWEASASPRALVVVTWALAFVAAGVAALVARRGRSTPIDVATSLSWPLVGCALVLPLSLHGLFFIEQGERDFARWVVAAWVVVGHAHLLLAVLLVRRVRGLVAGRPVLSAWTVWGIVVGASAIPGALLVLPPLLVAVTGLPFVALLHLTDGLVAAERHATS